MSIKIKINHENCPSACFHCTKEIPSYKGNWVMVGDCEVEYCNECVKELIKNNEINRLTIYRENAIINR